LRWNLPEVRRKLPEGAGTFRRDVGDFHSTPELSGVALEPSGVTPEPSRMTLEPSLLSSLSRENKKTRLRRVVSLWDGMLLNPESFCVQFFV
jgi:hypothetical protein